MWPIVAIGVAGFSGTMPGKDFETSDEEQAYRIPAHYFADTIVELLSENGAAAWEIKEKFVPVMTKETYLETLDSFNKSTIYKGE